jgi:hypothetical protein
MQQQGGEWTITIGLPSKRLLALLMVVAGLGLLGYGVLRPLLSAYLGERVSEQISTETAREVVAVLVGEVAGEAPADAVDEAAEQPPLAQQSPLTSHNEPAAAAILPVATPIAAVTSSAAVALVPSPVPVDSGSIIRAVAAPPTVQAVAQPPPQAAIEGASQAGSAPEATRDSGNLLPTTAALGATPIVAAPITAPNSGRSVEEVVAALPSGEITVTAQKLNSRIAARAGSLGPIEKLDVRFVPGEVQVVITVLGQDTVGRSGLAAVNGRVAAVNPQLSGALGALISVNDLVRPIEDELNAILETAGRQIGGVRIEQDQIVVTLE